MRMQYHDAEGNAAWAALVMEGIAPQPDQAPVVDPAQTRTGKVLDGVSKALRLCGHGRPMNLSVRIADTLYTDCACCIAWRGLTVGGAVGVILGSLATLGVMQWMKF